MTANAQLEAIDRFWVARLAGNAHAIRGLASDRATYEMVGAKTFADQSTVGPSHAGSATDRLVDDFQFHSREQLAVIVDGLKVATVNRLEVSFRGGVPVTTEACDVWQFDADGKIASLRQFVDTDLVRRMMNGQV